MDGQTDGYTDGQPENSIPSTNKGNKAVTPVWLKSTTPQSQIKHFSIELPIPKNENLPGN